MKKIILISLLFLFTALAVKVDAQSNAIGIRMGYYNGLTFKHGMGGQNNLEILATWYERYGSWSATFLYEWQQPLTALGIPNLDWLIGIGAHIGQYDYGRYYYKYDKNYYNDPTYHADRRTYFGADLILGLEYNFPSVPFNISLDWKPAFNFGYGHGWDGIALSFRFKF